MKHRILLAAGLCFFIFLYLFRIASEHAVSLYFCMKILILAAACVSQSQCPAHPQWLCELYNFTLFTGDALYHAKGYFSWQVKFALICFSFKMLLSYLGHMQWLIFLLVRCSQPIY